MSNIDSTIKFLPFGLALFILSCVKAPKSPPLTQKVYSGAWLLNEGNFGMGNGSIGRLSKDGLYDEDVFFKVNGFRLGDVVQSMTKMGDEWWIVVNNSGKIVVTDTALRHLRTITGFISPRSIIPVNREKCYITDLYANFISIVNPASGQITGRIPLFGWTEEGLTIGHEVWVTNESRTKIYIISSDMDQVTDSIGIPYGSNSLCLDLYGRLWVACVGDTLQGIKGGIAVLDPVQRKVLKQWDQYVASDLCINQTNDTLYFLSRNIFQIPIATDHITEIPKKGKHAWYGISAIPGESGILACDAGNYNQKGWVYRWNQGHWTDSTRVGIIPSRIIFP